MPVSVDTKEATLLRPASKASAVRNIALAANPIDIAATRICMAANGHMQQALAMAVPAAINAAACRGITLRRADNAGIFDHNEKTASSERRLRNRRAILR
ncbi:MAG: hypothetical protein KGJ49_04880 [Alphaproteobacteria bacterium]|nr:hypothetical protein [Alphaproteobacteria bacterium]